PVMRDGLAMWRQLYPKERFPDGHPHLAVSLNNLGNLLWSRGELAQAEPFSRDALAMHQSLAAAFADRANEAGAITYLASLPGTADSFPGVPAEMKEADPARTHALLWQGRAAVTRAVQSRQRLFRGLGDDRDRQKLQELLEVRRQLATLILAPASGNGSPARTTTAA